MPKYQVMRFQTIAPTTPAKTTPRPVMPGAAGSMMPLADGGRDLAAEVRADEVADRGHEQARPAG